jgi:hypothetical protein
LRQRDASSDPDLAALRIGAHRAACRDSHDLQAPAAAEQRRLRLQHFARKLDLPGDLRPAIINIQRRAGDRDAVIALEPADRQVRAGIGRIADVHDGTGQQFAQQFRIPVAHDRAAGRDLLGAQLGGIAFADQKTGGGGHGFPS